jgi:hypothetical protein
VRIVIECLSRNAAASAEVAGVGEAVIEGVEESANSDSQLGFVWVHSADILSSETDVDGKERLLTASVAACSSLRLFFLSFLDSEVLASSTAADSSSVSRLRFFFFFFSFPPSAALYGQYEKIQKRGTHLERNQPPHLHPSSFSSPSFRVRFSLLCRPSSEEDIKR